MDGLIYYIEDEEDIAWGVREYLQNKGFHVEVLGTAREAKAALERKLPSLALVTGTSGRERGTAVQMDRERWKELAGDFSYGERGSPAILCGALRMEWTTIFPSPLTWRCSTRASAPC